MILLSRNWRRTAGNYWKDTSQGALSQAFATPEIISAAGSAGEEILRLADKEKNGHDSNGQEGP